MATINELLVWKKVLATRYQELVGLRNENSKSSKRYYGANASENQVDTPVYDVKHLDKMIATIASTQRKLDTAIKNTNNVTQVEGFDIDEAVLGELA